MYGTQDRVSPAAHPLTNTTRQTHTAANRAKSALNKHNTAQAPDTWQRSPRPLLQENLLTQFSAVIPLLSSKEQ